MATVLAPTRAAVVVNPAVTQFVHQPQLPVTDPVFLYLDFWQMNSDYLSASDRLTYYPADPENTGYAGGGGFVSAVGPYLNLFVCSPVAGIGVQLAGAGFQDTQFHELMNVALAPAVPLNLVAFRFASFFGRVRLTNSTAAPVNVYASGFASST